MSGWREMAMGLVLAGCAAAVGDVEPGDTDSSTFEPPEVAGSYDATVSEIAGCDDARSAVAALTGPLDLLQEQEALTFVFGPGALGGVIDPGFGWEIEDSLEVDGWTLEVLAEGIAYSDEQVWVLEGDLAVDATDVAGAPCSMTALLVARELTE